MDKRLKIDPLELTLKNAIVPGNFSPSMIEITRSNLGDMVKVLEKLRDITNWKEGNYINIGDNKVRVKGIGCFWKAPNPSGDASAGAVITFNSDGSINLNIGSVEMGSGGKTIILKMLSEKLKMSDSRIFIENEINTKTTPLSYVQKPSYLPIEQTFPNPPQPNLIE